MGLALLATRSLRYLWASPTSLLGLAAVAALWALGGTVRVRNGVVEACGGRAGGLGGRARLVPGGIAAMALGHVVLAVDARRLEETRCHELVHVRQAERWGPFFLPAYLLASLWAWMRGRDPYLDNPFEREAYAAEIVTPLRLSVRAQSAATQHDRRER